MAIQTEPTRIQIPFADSGTKNVIPDTNSTPSASQAASWTDGFPAQCSLPLSAGGIPPARADFNGIFNVMTQSIRFGQEGGVWAWDATVDYGTNRMALGSDGKIYWSVAQSGPNVGGAQDPTTDTSIYWSTMPMLTPPLADDSSKAATTEWVRDLAAAYVYADASSGSDSNDGMSAATAVKTLQKAIDVAGAFAHAKEARIVVAGGNYSGNASISGVAVQMALQGNVAMSGDISVSSGGGLAFSGAYSLSTSGTFWVETQSAVVVGCSSWTHSGQIGVNRQSVVRATCAVSVSATGASNAIYVHGGSAFLADNAVTVASASSSSWAVDIDRGSYLSLASSLGISGSGNAGGLYVANGATAYLGGGVSVADCLSSGNGLLVAYGASCYIAATSEIYGSSQGEAIAVFSGSSLMVNGASTVVTAKGKSTSYGVVHADFCANIRFLDGTLKVVGATGTTNRCIHSADASLVFLSNLTVDGAFTNVVFVSNNAVLAIPSAKTVVNNATGARYSATHGGQIDVAGAGANRLPGSTAGTANATQFAFYG